MQDILIYDPQRNQDPQVETICSDQTNWEAIPTSYSITLLSEGQHLSHYGSLSRHH